MSALSKVRGVNIRKDDTKRMEEEARRMEAKLEVLRRTLDSSEAKVASSGSDGRWRAGSATKPLTRGYVKTVLEAPVARRSASQPRAPAAKGGTPTNSTPEPTFGELLAPARSPAAEAAAAPAAPAPAGRPIGAAANLQAAVRQQSKEAQEVETFMADLKLDRYTGLLLENGFDCMEIVREMEESHMREIGMSAGHALKLRKRLEELRPPRPPPEGLGSSARRVTFGAQATLLPARGGGTASAEAGEGAGPLKEGAFDEQESAASFQDALRAWREGRSTPSAGASSPGGVGVGSPGGGGATSSSSPKVAGSFWSTVGGEDMDLKSAATPTKPPEHEEKLCCYQCYRQFFAKHAVERSSPPEAGGPKRLCSEACAERWVLAVQAKAKAMRQRQESMDKMQAMERLMEEARRAAESPALGDAESLGASEGARHRASARTF